MLTQGEFPSWSMADLKRVVVGREDDRYERHNVSDADRWHKIAMERINGELSTVARFVSRHARSVSAFVPATDKEISNFENFARYRSRDGWGRSVEKVLEMMSECAVEIGNAGVRSQRGREMLAAMKGMDRCLCVLLDEGDTDQTW